jgi:hypothetical protein
MDGNEFRKKREQIEGVCDEIDTLVQSKSGEEAGKKLKTARKMIEQVSAKELGDIQKGAVFNLTIRIDHLSGSIDKLTA